MTYGVVEITEGTGTGVAVDDVSGVHYQAIKLIDGTVGSGQAIESGDGISSAALRVTLANDGTGVVALTPSTVTGLTAFHLVSAASTNATNIKASAGAVYGWSIYNTNANARKVALHNVSGTPTAGSSVFMTITVKGLDGSDVISPMGIPFSSGIGITTVTGAADSDASAVAANDLIINIFYT